MSDALEIKVLPGSDSAFSAALPALARLRIEVFREFPYLYDGDEAYEQEYLRTYLECAHSVVVLVMDKGQVVGASTGLPLSFETEACQRPFRDSGQDPATIFYCGESVLLPDYRGRGVYRAFFDGREQHARALGGFTRIVLCGVERPADHPRRPVDYAPLDPVWRHFGYHKRDDLRASFSWKDVDQPQTSEKSLVFWEKSL
jgi:GNAT superfamily N-acetyltransferase